MIFKSTAKTMLLMVFTLMHVVTADGIANPWGTLKPNLYFAVKEKAKE